MSPWFTFGVIWSANRFIHFRTVFHVNQSNLFLLGLNSLESILVVIAYLSSERGIRMWILVKPWMFVYESGSFFLRMSVTSFTWWKIYALPSTRTQILWNSSQLRLPLHYLDRFTLLSHPHLEHFWIYTMDSTTSATISYSF
jgi:hypothetical protein